MAMTPEKIHSLVGRITYKPDWSFDARTGYGECMVTINWYQRETNPDNAPDYDRRQDYAMKKVLHITADDYSSDVEVLRTILEGCIQHELEMLTHEAREFFRVQPEMRWDAPFHPHHYIGQEGALANLPGDGKTNWRETSHRQLDINKDLPNVDA